MRFIVLSAAVAALAFASAADAKSCKDAAGHFTKCPAPAAAPAKPASNKAGPGTCKDAKGHFAKCGTVASIAAPAPAAKPGLFSKPAAPVAKTTMARTGAAKCKTGVPCGKSCIPKGKVCHKN